MAAPFPRYTYIISKFADPIFAIFIGASAAAVRINREERAKGYTGAEIRAMGLRRVGLGAWGGMEAGGVEGRG